MIASHQESSRYYEQKIDGDQQPLDRKIEEKQIQLLRGGERIAPKIG